MTFWSSTSYIYFLTDKTLCQFYDFDTDYNFMPKYERFPWSIFNGCGMTAENAYSSGHMFSSFFWVIYICSNCLDHFPKTCHYFPRLSNLKCASVLSRFGLQNHFIFSCFLFLSFYCMPGHAWIWRYWKSAKRLSLLFRFMVPVAFGTFVITCRNSMISLVLYLFE